MSVFIQLNRFVVMKSGVRVYDEDFHSGLNIIRGSNGSGKSTITDLIFFALGGELDKWKKHALMCDEVVAEVNLSGTVVTLKREIDSKSQRPMQIFFGGFEKSLSSAIDGWTLINFARDTNGNRLSFSQAMFRVLNLPEIPGDGGSNITMHQILRLMYVDQASPFQRIFKAERFDAKDTREAISELLMGIGGYELYSLRLERRATKTLFDQAKDKYSSFLKAKMSFEQNFNLINIQAESSNIKLELEGQRKRLQNIDDEEISQKDISKEANDRRRNLFEEMSKTRKSVILLEHEQKALEIEIADSQSFIEHLSELLSEFEKSAAAFVSLGAIKFAHCPSCLTKLKEQHDRSCHLCGNDFTDEERRSKAMQVRLDLEGQLDESKALQIERLADLSEAKRMLGASRREFTKLTRQLDDIANLPVDGRSALVSEISRNIGKLESRLVELGKLGGMAEDLEKLEKEKTRLNELLLELDDKIKASESSRNKRRRIVMTRINEGAKFFIRKDMPEHNDFEELDDFKFNFEDDWFAVNGDPNISTSASGMVMLKNSLVLGILKASLEDPKMLFPRFVIQDNGEDKGMVGDRVRHFQKTISEWSDSITKQHQIILTTSSLNPSLDDEKYLVGPSYTKQNRTLRLATPKSQQALPQA